MQLRLLRIRVLRFELSQSLHNPHNITKLMWQNQEVFDKIQYLVIAELETIQVKVLSEEEN